MTTEEKVHLALPLKYRPMTFSDVVGQENVVKTLRNAIETNRIANAYLFIGSRGIGKTTLSRIFAKALNCLHEDGSKSAEPCAHCVNCEEIAAGRSLDVVELDAASHNKVEDVRPIIEAVQFKPVASKYKIFIIDECHMLSNAAWNALLKTLEEPPPYARFIFATTEGDKVLATIVSRCQRFDLRRIQTNDIVARLKYICEKESISSDEDALLAIARGAEGGMRDALSSLDQLVSFKGSTVKEEDALNVFGLVSRSALEELAGAILKGDSAKILEAIDLFDSSGKNLRRLAAELLNHFRNLVVIQALGANAKALEATKEQIAVLLEQAKLATPQRVFRICDQLVEMEDKLRYALSIRTILETSLIRAGQIATTATIEEIMRALRLLKEEGDANALKEIAIAQSGHKAQEPEGKSPAECAPEAGSLAPRLEESAPQAPLEEVEDFGIENAKDSSTAPIPPLAQKYKRSPKSVSGEKRKLILDDAILNEIISENPGSELVDIKEV